MLLPLPPDDRSEDAKAIAAFVARKVVTLKRSLSTAQDTEERIECVSACNFDPLIRGIGVQN
jgi:hypothetical protein